MYNIEVNNEYRNEFNDDFFPMYYYKVTCDGDSIVKETDWDYGFASVATATAFMEAYFPGEQFSITIKAIHYYLYDVIRLGEYDDECTGQVNLTQAAESCWRQFPSLCENDVRPFEIAYEVAEKLGKL